MGQKVHPVGIRLGIVKECSSVWYAERSEYGKNLMVDISLRAKLTKMLSHASVGRIQIDMMEKNAVVTIHTARPGVVIGKKGEDVSKLKAIAENELGRSVHINIVEIKKPELNASLVAQSIVMQLEKRVMFRRALKRSVQNVMRSGALGVKTQVSGRLGGAEIARREQQKEGRVPLHTFRADIDYAQHEALTTYGILGVKVWIFKGEILGGMAAVKEQSGKSKSRN